ncbi:MAG: Dihydroorotase and related cyclic amidohydrolase [Paenibacillus sp.]|jgi:dihydropyrimidinase/allantoinase|nr:Dihydroorotase and related cyclic amidohydrolase [Paenibacillus sp.]
MKLDLWIKNGLVYRPEEYFQLANVGIKDGKIHIISEPHIEFEAERVIDAEGLHVLPGMIDAHVHFREPAKNPADTESFFTGTRAAAAGGITSIVEMPNSFPCTYNTDLLIKRKEILRTEALIDYGLYGAAGSDHLEDIIPLADEGISAYKTFMHRAPAGREAEFEGFTMTGDRDLYEGFKQISQTGLPLALHAEHEELLSYFSEYAGHFFAEEDPTKHLVARNTLVETSAINRVVFFAGQLQVPVICCHVSSPEALEIIKRAKQDGIRVYAEMCPHYLIFDDSYLEKLGPYGKCNPPLRSTSQIKALWSYIEDGTIDYISSDHSPFPKALKDLGYTNIFKSPAGFPGTELTLPLMLDQVNKGKLSLHKLVELMSVNPAKTFGMYPDKGTLGIGTDADITIVDMNAQRTVNIQELYTVAKESALLYEGLELQGQPAYTVVRGKVVAERGLSDDTAKGWGRFIPRAKP